MIDNAVTALPLLLSGLVEPAARAALLVLFGWYRAADEVAFLPAWGGPSVEELGRTGVTAEQLRGLILDGHAEERTDPTAPAGSCPVRLTPLRRGSGVA